MVREIKRLPDSELEVMLIIWNSDKVLNMGEIHQQLTDTKTSPYQVTQTILSRLEDKAFVRREKRGRQNFFHPLVAEREYRARETATFLERLYGNSPARLLATLVESESISEGDLAEMKRILERE